MKNYFLFLLAIVILLVSCHSEFLDIKPDRKLVVPNNISDLQALLDNTKIMNERMPYISIASGDNLYLEAPRWQSLDPIAKNSYIWAEEVYEGTEVFDWDRSYEKVFYANTVLDELKKIEVEDQSTADNVKGSALFYRAFSFYHVAQLFSPPYKEETAKSDLGIPLRLSSDLEDDVFRSTVSETYDQMIRDVEEAIGLLPEVPVAKTRPSKAAAHALLANVYLHMQRYDQALLNAEMSLAYNSVLMDYNELKPTDSYPIPKFNEEVLFSCTMPYTTIFTQTRFNVHPDLYKRYLPDDLRKSLFFLERNGLFVFKGSYDGSRLVFNGFSTNEMYLVAAECYARLGSVKSAAELLNQLLMKRYAHGTFEAVTEDNGEELLSYILEERRKELVFRGIRWHDLRRLNLDKRFAIDIEREIDNDRYVLKANDPRYTLPIPEEVIKLSGIEQNER